MCEIFYFLLPGYWHILCYGKAAEVMQDERMDAMANAVKYSGICETCDHYQACVLKRIPQLEVIQCEEFCTHTVVNNVSAVPADAALEDPTEICRGEK
jgi:hypothetical protein